MIKVWRYWIIRPKLLFLLSQLALLTAVLLLVLWEGETRGSELPLRDEIGLILLLLFPQICCYFNGLDSSLVDPDFRHFVGRTLASLAMGLLLTLPVFVFYPAFFPGYWGALVAIGFSALLLFGLRPLLQWLIRRRKFVEGLLILGTGDLARKVYKELSGPAGHFGAQVLEDGILIPKDGADCPEPFEDSGELIG